MLATKEYVVDTIYFVQAMVDVCTISPVHVIALVSNIYTQKGVGVGDAKALLLWWAHLEG